VLRLVMPRRWPLKKPFERDWPDLWMSPGNASQIEAKALRKLRHPNRQNGVLKEYIK